MYNRGHGAVGRSSIYIVAISFQITVTGPLKIYNSLKRGFSATSDCSERPFLKIIVNSPARATLSTSLFRLRIRCLHVSATVCRYGPHESGQKYGFTDRKSK